jgi:hypothetical protein
VNVVPGPRRLLLLDQVQEERADVVERQPVGSTVKIAGECENGVDVRADRVLGVVANLEIIDHLLA